MTYIKYITVFLLICFAFATSVHAASFDCTKASTKIEKIICNDEELSKQDAALATAYADALKNIPDPKELIIGQREWLKERNNCMEKTCLSEGYRKRIGELERIGSKKGTSNNNKDTDLARLVMLVNDKISKPIINHDAEICAGFLEDFKKQSGITYIKPIIEADKYEDPRFDPYKQQCPDFDWHRGEVYLPGVWDSVKDLPKEEQEKSGSISYATRNFRLYQVNINNNAADGKELVFYSEGYVGPSLKPTGGNYLYLDVESCQTNGGVSTAATINSVTNNKTDNYSYIVNYKSQNYILTYVYSGVLKIDKYYQEYQSFIPFCTYN